MAPFSASIKKKRGTDRSRVSFFSLKPLQVFGLVPEMELLLSEFDDFDLDLHFPFLDHIDFLRRPAGDFDDLGL